MTVNGGNQLLLIGFEAYSKGGTLFPPMAREITGPGG